MPEFTTTVMSWQMTRLIIIEFGTQLILTRKFCPGARCLFDTHHTSQNQLTTSTKISLHYTLWEKSVWNSSFFGTCCISWNQLTTKVPLYKLFQNLGCLTITRQVTHITEQYRIMQNKVLCGLRKKGGGSCAKVVGEDSFQEQNNALSTSTFLPPKECIGMVLDEL